MKSNQLPPGIMTTTVKLSAADVERIRLAWERRYGKSSPTIKIGGLK